MLRRSLLGSALSLIAWQQLLVARCLHSARCLIPYRDHGCRRREMYLSVTISLGAVPIRTDSIGLAGLALRYTVDSSFGRVLGTALDGGQPR